jgi:ribose 5-phosphate isomerase RpiB
MTGFHVDPEVLAAQARAVDDTAADVKNGVAAEMTAAGQADFGVLIGATIGAGIHALAQHFEEGLRATHTALSGTADGLRNTEQIYRSAEASNVDGIKGSGAGH